MHILTIGTLSQSSASFIACWAFAIASFGSIVSASGQSPGAIPSTNAATAVPSFQSEVKSLIFFCGIFDYKENNKMMMNSTNSYSNRYYPVTLTHTQTSIKGICMEARKFLDMHNYCK